MKRFASLVGTVVLLCACRAVIAQNTVVLGTEDPTNGLVVDLVGPSPALTVASDGDGPFTPFGLTFPVSDAISLNDDWVQDPSSAWQKVGNVYYITEPASESGPEPIGKWYFSPGSPWNSGTPDTELIMDSNGRDVSDVIHLLNEGPNGQASITFQSGTAAAVPEPGALALLSSVVVPGLLLVRRRRA
jgi:hypothetical protein